MSMHFGHGNGSTVLTKACSFSALPTGGESDLRMLYCAFVISSLLDDWSGIDLDRAIAYTQSCYVSSTDTSSDCANMCIEP